MTRFWMIGEYLRAKLRGCNFHVGNFLNCKTYNMYYSMTD